MDATNGGGTAVPNQSMASPVPRIQRKVFLNHARFSLPREVSVAPPLDVMSKIYTISGSANMRCSSGHISAMKKALLPKSHHQHIASDREKCNLDARAIGPEPRCESEKSIFWSSLPDMAS